MYTPIHLQSSTTRPYLATFLETAAFKLLLPSINSSTKRPTVIPSHRNLQFKSWLSNPRARRPSCSTRRRSMPQRLLPMRKRTARTASTLAADLRRPVAIPRDTVSLSLSAAVFVFFPSAPPRPNAASCRCRHYCCYMHHSFTAQSAFALPLSLTSLHFFLLRNQLGCNTLHSDPPQHMRQTTPRAVTFQQGLCNG